MMTPVPTQPAVVRVGLAWALLGVVMFSFSVPLTKIAVGGFSPFFTATGRAVIAGAIALLLLAVRRVPWPDRSSMKPLIFTMLGAVFGWLTNTACSAVVGLVIGAVVVALMHLVPRRAAH